MTHAGAAATTAGGLDRARSFLFVPADRPERLPKALASGAHGVIVDLEDAVAAQAKSAARDAVARAFAALPAADLARLTIRINALDTPHHPEDLSLLRSLAGRGIGAVMLAKADSCDSVRCVADACRALVVPLIETAAGLHHVDG